jgi:hypothetical protein
MTTIEVSCEPCMQAAFVRAINDGDADVAVAGLIRDLGPALRRGHPMRLLALEAIFRTGDWYGVSDAHVRSLLGRYAIDGEGAA